MAQDLERRAERWTRVEGHVEELRATSAARLWTCLAEDAAQEALLRAATWKGQLPAPQRMAVWLATIARNFAIDQWRRDRRLTALDAATHVEVDPDPYLDSAIHIRQALARLSRGDRALLGALARGYRYAELAEQHLTSPAVIRKRVARARARLLSCLEEEKNGTG